MDRTQHLGDQLRRAYVFAPHDSPPAGPCLICGRHPDKRHRLWDVIRDRFVAGESIGELAKDYGYSRDEMEQWLRLAITDPHRVTRNGGGVMLSIYDEYPELTCEGDPFIAEIVKADDIIDDHRYNAEWLGLSDDEGEVVAQRIERERLSVELSWLYRWFDGRGVA